MKCLVCEEQAHDQTGLCYLHLKYAQGLTGPYFETLYDLLWWKATFLPEWDRLGLGKIQISCNESTNARKINEDLVAETKSRVRESLNSMNHELDKYLPLVRREAINNNHMFGVAIDELIQVGCEQLFKLEGVLPESLEPKQVSVWVRKSIKGSMRAYSIYNMSVVKKTKDSRETQFDRKSLDCSYRDDCFNYGGYSTPDRLLADKEDMRSYVSEISSLIGKFSSFSRQAKILNLIVGGTTSRKALAEKLGVTTRTIRRDIDTIKAKAKEK